MEIFAIAGTAFMIGLSGSLIPGPMLTVSISESIRRGFWAGPLIVLGHGIVEIMLLIALALGMGQLFAVAWVGPAISIIGGTMLIYIAHGIIKEAWTINLQLVMASANSSQKFGPVITGGLVSVSNPTWILWWATIGVTYVAWASTFGFPGLVSFFGGHIMADFAWYAFVAFIVASGRKFISEKVYKVLLIVCGLFLIGLSLFFIISGIRYFFFA